MYPQIFGKYILERELARGGMARIVLATLRGADGFEKKLVVKQIRDELAFDETFIRRFIDEAKTTVALNHPTIVPVYELGVEQGIYFLTMELVEGVSVAELLASRRRRGEGGLSPEQGAYVGVAVCRALDYAHRKMNMVHRDITPRNVMVDEEGQVKIIDFGIATRAQVEGAEVFGTLGYMPPEQMDGHELTPATDLFGVGVLLMEVWSGAPPFKAKTREECEARMRAEPQPRPSACYPELAPLDAIIASSIAVDPHDRPQHADDLGRALRKYLSTLDEGDIARTLGEQVRALRAAPSNAPSAPTTASADIVATATIQTMPLRVSRGDLGTQTFAIRREVNEWSPDDAVQMGREEGTRRLPTPTSESAVESAPQVTSTPNVDREGIRPAQHRWMVPVAVAGLLSLIAIVAWRGWSAGYVKRNSVTPSDAHGDTIPTAPESAATNRAHPPSSLESPPATASSRQDPPPSTATSPSHLSIIGDVGTRVIIDGVSRGHCPLRNIALEPGMHLIRFTFEPTGEVRETRMTFAPGVQIVLRADFTGATPSIHIVD